MTNVAVRWALKAYPPSFRERYGGELKALVEDTGSGPSVVANLLTGALQAWLRPVMPDVSAERRRRRMQASVATTWVSWCAALYALQLLHLVRTELLGPVSVPWVQLLFDVALYAMYTSALIPLVGALLLLAESFRSGNWVAWRPLVAPIAMLPVGMLGLWALAFRYLFDEPSSRLWDLGWLGPAAFLIAVAASPAVAVTRFRPSAGTLRLLALLAMVMAFAVTTAGIACAAAVTTWLMGGGEAPMPSVLAAVAAGATVVAVVSSGRGAISTLQQECPVDLVGDV